MKLREEKKELENLINNVAQSSSENVPLNQQTPELNSEPLFDMDFDEVRKECNKQAKEMIHNATGFVLSDEVVKNNLYLKDKIKIDIESLSGMLYQLKVNEMMQRTLMEQVRSGNVHNRMFEVFSTCSKTIGELNKQLIQTVEAIKTTYRDIKSDAADKEMELKQLGVGDSNLLRNDKGLVSMGTKDLIKSVKERNKDKVINVDETYIEDVSIVKE
jgi:hypothetical protein